jgi:hypothetical protein
MAGRKGPPFRIFVLDPANLDVNVAAAFNADRIGAFSADLTASFNADLTASFNAAWREVLTSS